MRINRFINQPFMSKALVAKFSDKNFVQAMLDVELAIIEVRENNNLIEKGTLNKTKQALAINKFDLDAISEQTYLGGNAAIPFVQQAKHLLPEDLKPYFHKTVTSQDVVDSAMMLMVKSGLIPIIQDLIAILNACHYLIDMHRATPMVGRTLMQHALPITFGVKVARWVSSLISVIPQLIEIKRSGLYLQWGGPVGVSTEENEQHELPKQVAQLLGLTEPLLPWHTNRQPIHRIGSTLDAIAGTFENIVTDISLMSQSEIGEVAEPSIKGMGGSSSMPHKRNPVLCALVKSASLRIHGHLSVISNTTAQPFERGLGEWHASWTPLIESVALLAGSTGYMKVLLEDLQVYPKRMAKNLDLNSDAYLIKPLQAYISKTFISDSSQLKKNQLMSVINEASEQAHKQHIGFVQTLQKMINEDKVNSSLDFDLSESELISLLSPLSYCGASQRQCDKALSALEKYIAFLKREI